MNKQIMKQTDLMLNEHQVPFISTNGCNSMTFGAVFDLAIAAFLTKAAKQNTQPNVIRLQLRNQ